MLEATYNMLKEKLGDVKYEVDGEERVLFDDVVDWEEGLGKVKLANKDLTGQRETWENERKELRQSVKDYEGKIAEFEAKLKDTTISPEEKKRLEELKAGGYLLKDEVEKQMNAITEKLNVVTSELETAKADKLKTLEQEKLAKKSSFESTLDKELMETLGKYKIAGDQASAALLMIKQKGNAKVIENADGTYGKSFAVVKDGKELASDLDSICKNFAEVNPWAVSPSGRIGPGESHTNNSINASAITGKSTEEIRHAFESNL